MKTELKSDVKFFAVGLIGGIITLFLPVVLWNVWFLDYIDAHGKFWAWVLAPVFALISAVLFVGVADLHKRMFGAGQTNPFWGWFIIALIVEIFIVAFSNS